MTQDLSAYVNKLEEEAHRRTLELETLRAESEQVKVYEERKAREFEAQEQRKTAVAADRWRVIQWLGTGILIVLVIGGLCGWIYTATNDKPGPNPDDAREKACFAQGGGFIPRDMLDGSADDRGICVFPGKRVGQ